MTQQVIEPVSLDSDLPESHYPPAPWRMSGQLWMGIFEIDSPIALPAGLHRFLSPNWAVVMLIRYLEGTLHYDELAFGALVRKGARVGIWVDHIWVDDLASVWGGRRIWGLPKEMAQFEWNDNQVTVTDKVSTIATFTVNTQPSKIPALWIPAPGFGLIADSNQLVYTMASVRVRLGRSDLRIDDWSGRFPYHPRQPTPHFTVSAKPFHMTVPAARHV